MTGKNKFLISSFLSFSVLAINPAMATTTRSQSQLPSQWREGFDRESPEAVEKANREIKKIFRDAVEPRDLTEEEKSKILKDYDYMDFRKEVPRDLLETAVLYFDKNKKKFSNQKYITIIDFKPRSDEYRFFVIHVGTGVVEKYHTTHGIGSDQNDDGIAEKFLNIPNSGASSIGFVRTGETYSGKFRRSLRLDGLSLTNSKIRQRAVVVHGWDYAFEDNVIQGLSWGCPALDWKVKDQIIDKIKNGSLISMNVSER